MQNNEPNTPRVEPELRSSLLDAMVGQRLLARWREDIRVCVESAKLHRKEGSPGLALQLDAQAGGLRRCADELEKALALPNAKEIPRARKSEGRFVDWKGDCYRDWWNFMNPKNESEIEAREKREYLRDKFNGDELRAREIEREEKAALELAAEYGEKVEE